MATKYVNVDRATPMLLPPDVRDWVAGNDLAHFILEAVEATNLATARVNARGTGDAQYPPAMMLALLIYSYATGTFSSRAMERAGYDSLAMRYLCANHHPDHDTIAKFRRDNGALLKACFVRVLELAREMGLLKLGTVSVDGTKIAARAAKGRNLTRAQIQAHVAALQQEVDTLLARAEAADGPGQDDGTSLPEELASRQKRLERLRAAQRALEQRDRESDRPPGPDDTIHPGDPDSRIMPTAQGPFIQGYNVQAAVSAEGTTLIVGAHVVTATNDREQLVAAVAAIPAELGTPHTVLADTGYDTSAQIQELNRRAIQVHCPPQKVGRQAPRQLDRRAIWQERCTRRDAFDQPAVRQLYGRRAAASEPTFHITKRLMGFVRFSLRGFTGVNLEWDLVSLAFNCRKIAQALA